MPGYNAVSCKCTERLQLQLITLGLFLQHLPNPVQQPVPYLQWKVVLFKLCREKRKLHVIHWLWWNYMTWPRPLSVRDCLITNINNYIHFRFPPKLIKMALYLNKENYIQRIDASSLILELVYIYIYIYICTYTYIYIYKLPPERV